MKKASIGREAPIFARTDDLFRFEDELDLKESYRFDGKYLGDKTSDDEEDASLPAGSGLAARPGRGMAIPHPRKAFPSMFARPIGSYKGPPLHFTPFERERLYSGVVTNPRDANMALSFSERFALEEKE